VSLGLLKAEGAGVGFSSWGAGASTVRDAKEGRRPRLEASIDHDLGSSRSSRDDDIPPQMYDKGVPHRSEEAVLHASKEGAGGSTSSAASIPYKRGPSQLPK
jgi:hypothetical protein